LLRPEDIQGSAGIVLSFNFRTGWR